MAGAPHRIGMYRQMRRAATTAALIAGVLGACSDSTPKCGGGRQLADQASAGSGSQAAGSGSQAAGSGSQADSGVASGAAAAGATASACDMARADRVVDFQVTGAFLRTNPLGIVVDPRIYGPKAESLPWLKEPFCECRDAETLGTHVLGDGATDIAVLGVGPYQLPNEPDGSTFAWNNDDLIAWVAELNARFEGRVLMQATIMPNDRIKLQLEMMERLAPFCVAWKVFTDFAPIANEGFFLHEADGARMVAKALELGVPIITVAKGKSWSLNPYASPSDIGPAANMFPEARFVVTNAAFEYGLTIPQTSAPDPERPDEDLGWGRGVGEWPEGPYEESNAQLMEKYPLARGVNSLIKSLRDAGIGPNGTRLDGSSGPTTHVYVTTGAAWPQLISRPEEAMHFLGKLLKHVGEDRILWGSDSPNLGSPAMMMEEFRRFEISEDMQQRYGYPALTAERKQKILGGNALRMLAETGGVVTPSACP